MNAEAVFDIEASDGKRIRGGVRTLQLTDLSSGQTARLGTVKESVRGELLPPNKLLYADAFDGIEADVLLVWKHNAFSHDVLLKERPELPAGWHAENVRLEVVTEFIVNEEPGLRKTPVRTPAGVQLEDALVVDFGALDIITGKAFRLNDETAVNLGGLTTHGTPVQKQWHRTEDGRRFLIESLSWAEAEREMRDLPVARQAQVLPRENTGTAFARTWPNRPAQLSRREAIQLASANYEPAGYLVDFVIIPDEGMPTTLLAGKPTTFVRVTTVEIR